ncbi:Ig-like domain-containing protein [Levilactobacillus spicheri]|uniref:Gram-positive cocci surface proteins LPxTG domain-containing protein n=1 Tax=Levilactobacillus spicheri TaxID=216463 RepID=A0A0F3RR27_9LACO|nr:Ig-like domain-containing protein [Levilactobacillus spicheri]KJW12325.1 hypothetical protein VC81_07335 [Levilactobacillus spicheri]
MKKNHQVLKWLILMVGALVVMFVGQRTLTAQAASIDGSSYVTSAKVTNGPDFKPGDTIYVNYHLEFGDTPLHSGDVITVPLPDNLKSSKTDTFDIYAPDGKTVIGQAQVTKGGQSVEVTLNDKAEGMSNKNLDLTLATKYNGNEYGEQDVNFPNNHEDEINIVPNDANLSKKGTLQDDNTVKWTVLVNRRELELKNLKVTDTIGPNQTMIKDVTVSKAYWESNSTYKREKPALVEGQDYTVTYNDGGFDLAFTDTVSDMIAIDYYTKIDDPSVINDGYVFRNEAEMSWGSGSGSGSNKEVANGKVSTTGKNTGSGNGDSNTGTDIDEGNNGGEPGGNGDLDGDGNPDTGTVDVDGGTETDQEQTDREGEENATKQPNQPTKSKTATKKATQATPTAKQAAGAQALSQSNRRNHTGKLPQTNEARSWARVAGLGLLTSTVALAAGRRFF